MKVTRQMIRSWDDVAGTVQFTAPINLVAIRERIAADARVLDLGCGYGRIAHELSLAGFTNIQGYDISEKMIARAKEEYPTLELDVADAATLPEPAHSFDAVVVAALFTSIPEPQRQRAVVGEVRRVLKPGGTVHGVEFLRNPGTKGGAVNSRAGIAMWHFEPQELRDLFGAFTGWTSWREDAPSLSGSPATVLQFVAYDRA